MDDPFAVLSYLTRSPNRVEVLASVVDQPRARPSLVDALDASRVTVGRILAEYEDRGWVERDGRVYAATNEGRAVARTVRTALDEMAGLAALGPILPWLPVDRLDLPLPAFADATVVLPTETDPIRPIRHLSTLGADADEVRMYSVGVAPEAVTVHLGALAERDQGLRLVLAREAVETAPPDLAAGVADLVDAGATVEICEADPVLPFFGTFDETVAVATATDAGAPSGVVVSDAPAARAWVGTRLDETLAGADSIHLDTFTA
jgi:hypothetical protein